jgi:hypothetical protein
MFVLSGLVIIAVIVLVLILGIENPTPARAAQTVQVTTRRR